MSADAAFRHMPAPDIRKRVLQLRSFVDQGEFSGDEDNTLLGQIFTEDELEWLEEKEPALFSALMRVEKDYNRLTDVSEDLEQSQEAVDAFATIIDLESEAAEDADEGEDDAEDDEEDPDADLD